jgi:hypothetical protein
LVVVSSCGGESPDSTPSPLPGGPGGGTGGGTTNVKVLTATITPVATTPGEQVPPPSQFTASIAGGGYGSGVLSFNGVNNNTSLTVAINIPGPGTYSLALGNPNNGIGTWIDSTGIYRSQTNNGGGTIRVTTATLGRITGTFDMVGHDFPAGVGSPQVRRVNITNGVFDITLP